MSSDLVKAPQRPRRSCGARKRRPVRPRCPAGRRTGNEMQGGDENDGGRQGEVQRAARFLHDRLRVAQVGVDVLEGPSRVHTTRQATVVIHVDDLGFGSDGLCDGMRGVRRRQTRPDVEKLPYPLPASQVAHRASQERPVGPRPRDHLGAAGGNLSGCLTVGCQAILPAQPYVVDALRCAGRMSPPGCRWRSPASRRGAAGESRARPASAGRSRPGGTRRRWPGGAARPCCTTPGE
jgi:hypothetical protein